MKLALITPGYAPIVQRRGMELCEQGWEVLQITDTRVYHATQNRPVIPKELAYRLQPIHVYRVAHPHRGVLLTHFHWLKAFAPDVIAVERDPDTLIALQTVIARRLWSPHARLVLHSWQNVSRPLSSPVRWVLTQTLRAADGICYANREGLDILKQWGYTGYPVYQIWQGVDTTVFYPRAAADLRRAYVPDGSFLVGYIGRLAPEKGLSDIIAALTQLPQEIHSVFIGSGPEQSKLQAQAQERSIAERVHFLGRISHTALPEYFSMLDALILPSYSTPVWKEQFGRVLIEAMACGIPCIGSDSGAIPEVIGPAGLIFPEGNSQALAANIRQLYTTPTLHTELRKRARLRVADHYTLDKVAGQLAQIYRDIATLPRKSSTR